MSDKNICNNSQTASCSVKKTSIGGQALIEGIMMKSPEKTAMAVRNVTTKFFTIYQFRVFSISSRPFALFCPCAVQMRFPIPMPLRNNV